MTYSNTAFSGEVNSPLEAPPPCQGWEEQLQRMAEDGNDALLDANIFALTEWDEAE